MEGGLVEYKAVDEWMSCLAIEQALHLDGHTGGIARGGTCYKHQCTKDGLKDGEGSLDRSGSHPVAEPELGTNYSARGRSSLILGQAKGNPTHGSMGRRRGVDMILGQATDLRCQLFLNFGGFIGMV